jgi:4-hydroxybenzoate polyprenyltransferase
LFRLIHPFPSLLNGVITAALVLLAGGAGHVALRLGIAMVALQASIGALNDLVDAPRDAGRKAAKPIPAGLVTPAIARVTVLAGLAAGLALSAMSGLPALAVAVAGVLAGYLYDLRLKGTTASWAPFAVGLPLLPVFAWVGATGGVPPFLAIVVPLAALAGAGLAIANALADYERDLDAGTVSVATRLGLRRGWRLHAILQVAVVLTAVAAAALDGGSIMAIVLRAVAPGLVILAGVALGYRAAPGRRELAWEVEAAGAGLLALAWLSGAVGMVTLPS